MSDPKPKPNPLRNESDAFRLLTVVAAAGAVVVAVTLLAGSVPGAVTGAVLLALGARAAWRIYRA